MNAAPDPPSSHPAPSLADLLRAAGPPMARDLPDFDPAAAPATPGALLREWLEAALTAAVPDPTAVVLSTVAPDGLPDARVLVLRGVTGDGGEWAFATDAGSPKGRHLAEVPGAALTAYWPTQGRQIRVRGPVVAAPADRSRADFLGRSPASRTAMLIGRQSEPLASAAEWTAEEETLRTRHGDAPREVPAGHTLYLLRATDVEFWQGSADRRHRRLRYTRAEQEWERIELWP
ncbi:pyridoxal 5'-phosphate synthase [Streptomyces sp. ST2-7A]|uniref:pyridoxine/pyridoxamine 5'-phosphate oxidase n=1 Tax=Streptomyces sp. ST2-7A TaxID=2907214 RepID=UPI001F41FBA4|nr:pyridoxal 5'-phosphate synthase [Streptomyces sp. ST2-7A]MCE7083366.1 pyridoxal 5'-phosphate synthase [Streptomyces sp. ST2-7A]